MSYATMEKGRPNPVALAAVIGIHAALGAALLAGLAIEYVQQEKNERIRTWFEKKEIPPPPKPETQPEVDTREPTVPPPYFPPSPLPKPEAPVFESVPNPVPNDNIVVRLPVAKAGPELIPVPQPRPTMEPVTKVSDAVPRNSPGGWVTVDDYKTSWINREYTGTARFRLKIAANGSVENCTLQGSTGHAALDEATCRLITRRARFTPAKLSDGSTTAGTYTGSIVWRLPD